jgi:serine/threonine protein phosphatase PrpC
MATMSFKAGFAKTGYISTTALVTLMSGNKLYVANCGDSKAYLVREKGDSYDTVCLNRVHDANNPEEQARLKREFPKDKDIYICDKS